MTGPYRGSSLRHVTRSPDLLVRVLLFAGWGLGLVSLLDSQEMPFFVLTILGGLLLIAAGIALASDGGRAMASLNERYARWQRVPPYGVTRGDDAIVKA
jgi:hypothetical protein